MKKLFTVLFCLTLIACEKHGLECQTPPPTLRFSIRYADTTRVFNAEKVTITYQDSKGQLSSVTDIRYQNGVFETYDLAIKAHETGNKTTFSVAADGEPISDLYLTTYKSTASCDGWVHASEIRSGGKLLEIDKSTYSYLITAGQLQ